MYADSKETGEKRVSEVFPDRLVVKGYEAEWDQQVNQDTMALQDPRDQRVIRVPSAKLVQMDSLVCRVRRAIRV